MDKTKQTEIHQIAYKEVANTIRHYSNSSFQVRTLALVQGLVLLGAWLVSYQSQNSPNIVLILIAALGLFLTILLYNFYKSYANASSQYYKIAENMELKLFQEDFRLFTRYNKFHKILF